MLLIALMLLARPPRVLLLPTAKSAQHLHRILNASTQMTLPLAVFLSQNAPPTSVQTQSMGLTQPVPLLKHWLHALQMPPIAPMLSVRLPPVPL